ncbi:MAG: hypothetical protein M1838_004221 [Thelocarpon superellum]|nr:MAG: hypothetical protein M1838_004221 [Thelocarpon superellum]
MAASDNPERALSIFEQIMRKNIDAFSLSASKPTTAAANPTAVEGATHLTPVPADGENVHPAGSSADRTRAPIPDPSLPAPLQPPVEGVEIRTFQHPSDILAPPPAPRDPGATGGPSLLDSPDATGRDGSAVGASALEPAGPDVGQASGQKIEGPGKVPANPPSREAGGLEQAAGGAVLQRPATLKSSRWAPPSVFVKVKEAPPEATAAHLSSHLQIIPRSASHLPTEALDPLFAPGAASAADNYPSRVPDWAAAVLAQPQGPAAGCRDEVYARFRELKHSIEDHRWDKDDDYPCLNTLMLKALARSDMNLLENAFFAFMSREKTDAAPLEALPPPDQVTKYASAATWVQAARSASGSKLQPTASLYIPAQKDTAVESSPQGTGKEKGAARGSFLPTVGKTSRPTLLAVPPEIVPTDTQPPVETPPSEQTRKGKGRASSTVEAKKTVTGVPSGLAARGPTKKAALVRRVALSNLFPDSTATSILSLVSHGALEKITVGMSHTSALVFFLHAEECHKYVEATSGSFTTNTGTVFVSLGDVVDPVDEVLQALIDSGATRCIKVMMIKGEKGQQHLAGLTKKQGNKVENFELITTDMANQQAIIRFCNIRDAVRFKGELVRDHGCEQNNVIFDPDPCATPRLFNVSIDELGYGWEELV